MIFQTINDPENEDTDLLKLWELKLNKTTSHPTLQHACYWPQICVVCLAHSAGIDSV
jgi:hypothetical protein